MSQMDDASSSVPARTAWRTAWEPARLLLLRARRAVPHGPGLEEQALVARPEGLQRRPDAAQPAALHPPLRREGVGRPREVGEEERRRGLGLVDLLRGLEERVRLVVDHKALAAFVVFQHRIEEPLAPSVDM